MTDYISREAALLSMTPIVKRASERNRNILSAVKQCVEAINWCPAADVEPVRHGKWIWDDEGYHCTECFYHAYGETGEVLSGHWNYCPNCGARCDL